MQTKMDEVPDADSQKEIPIKATTNLDQNDKVKFVNYNLLSYCMCIYVGFIDTLSSHY